MPTTPESTGLSVIGMARAGHFEAVRDLFAPSLRPMVSAEGLRSAWVAELGRQGPLLSVGPPVSESTGPGMTLVKLLVGCERGSFTVVLLVHDSGQLSGIQLAPPSAALPTADWEPPTYADPRCFHEEELTVGPPHLDVAGTLTVPSQDGRWPAVVLLAGSGPLDRDETMGRNKPFKDLAWGLATLGLTVLRFDKVTYSRGSQVRGDVAFTVADEYMPQAVSAVRLLRDHPSVDPDRMFLLGHSLGGTIAPRIAADETSIAGIVILAGGAQPLQWAMVRQMRYLASLDEDAGASAQPAIDIVTKQAEMVDSPNLTASTSAGSLPFGMPAPYWLDLREYDPVKTAAAVETPMLILQGGRDYQATVADDLSRWEAGLSRLPDVTIRIFDSDNHLFFPGAGYSTPAEYEAAQHVDPAVVSGIAEWVKGQGVDGASRPQTLAADTTGTVFGCRRRRR